MPSGEKTIMKKYVLGAQRILSAAPDNFAAELQQTTVICGQLSGNLKRLQKDNKRFITVLGYSKQAADSLTDLNGKLTSASTALQVVSIIPEVRTAATQLKRSIDSLNSTVKSAKNTAVAIEKRVKPIRDALVNIDKGLAAAIKAVDDLGAYASQFLAVFNKIRKCIDSLPDGAPKQYGQQFIVEFSMAYTPEVSEMNKALSSVNDTISAFYNALNQLAGKLNFLKPLIDGVETILKSLNPILGPLQKVVDALLNIKITIPPVPIPYIPKMTVSLYDILDKFNEFADMAMKILQPLLDLIPTFKIPLPPIPGISDLINFNLNIIPDLPDFTDIFAHIEMWLPKITVDFKRFTLECPPKTGKISFLPKLRSDLADVHQHVHDGGYFAIKASNGKFLTVRGDTVTAQAGKIGDDSKFLVRTTVDKKISLMTKDGKFVRVMKDGSLGLVPSLPNRSCFMKIVPNDVKSFSLQGPGNKYIGAAPVLKGGYKSNVKACQFKAVPAP